MILSGAIFVGGAVGFEALGGLRRTVLENQFLASALASQPDPIYMALTTVEELLEMLGIALFVYTLLRHYEQKFGALKIRIVGPPFA